MNQSTEPLSYLSLGWGIQSSALAAMMALGEIPRSDYLIHSDTTHEKEGTYAYAERMIPWLGEHGLDVVTVTANRPDIVRSDWGKTGSVMVPAFSVDKGDGSHGQVRRQCTYDWKIVPIRRFVREELKRLGRRKAPGAVKAIMGISADEWRRVRDSDVQYIENHYPLVDLGLTRDDCILWMADHGLPVPPKSACTFCPYQSLSTWRDLKRQGGLDWREAVATDQIVRDMRPEHTLYLHPHRRPVAEAVELPEDKGQLALALDFEAPCDSGVCFV